MHDLEAIRVGFPFQLDGRGRLASPPHAQAMEQLIEQVLRTSPGERVNRPSFGCGLRRAVFAAQSPEQISALEAFVQAALHRWLGDLLHIDRVAISTPSDDRLEVRVRYTDRQRSASSLVTFELTRS